MIHEVFPVGLLGCNCSIIGDENSHEAMVIDPGDEVEKILARIASRGLRLTQIVITHWHIDHIGGATKLKMATGAPILMNEKENRFLNLLPMQAELLGMDSPGVITIDSTLTAGDRIAAGKVSGDVLHTPGHTEGSVCLYFDTEKKLVAGDTLFAGGIGRTDLPGGDYRKIIASLQNTVMSLPDDVVVVPGHGPLTTIGEERESNPFLTK